MFEKAPRRTRLLERIVNGTINGILSVLVSADREELRKLPSDGPYIIIINHVNFLEAPLLYLSLLPRRMTALAKKETWNNPVLAGLADLWGAIPIDRSASDRSAFARALEALGDGKVLIVAPEGTRSHNGILLEGHPGFAMLALRSGVPVFPLAHSGGERFWHNLKRLKRTRVTIRVGPSFRITPTDSISGRTLRRMVVSEAMTRLAELLPERYRGAYAEQVSGKCPYISTM